MLLVLFSLHGLTFERSWLFLLLVRVVRSGSFPVLIFFLKKKSYFKCGWGKSLEIHPFDTHPMC